MGEGAKRKETAKGERKKRQAKQDQTTTKQKTIIGKTCFELSMCWPKRNNMITEELLKGHKKLDWEKWTGNISGAKKRAYKQ